MCRDGIFNCKECKEPYYRLIAGSAYTECALDCNHKDKFKNAST